MSVAKVRCQLPKPNRVGPITIGRGNPFSGDPVRLSVEKLPLAGRCDLSSGLSLTILLAAGGTFSAKSARRGATSPTRPLHRRGRSASPMARASAGLSSTWLMAITGSLASPRATNIPVRSCDTYSGMPRLYVETTGVPHACASNVGSPDGSFQTDGNTRAAARR